MPFPAVGSNHFLQFLSLGESFFLSLKKKKRLCVYSLQCRALAAQMQLCGVEAEGAGPLISREAPPASVGEHPGLGLGGG